MLAGIAEKDLIDLPGCPSVRTEVCLDANTIRRRGSQDRRFPVHFAGFEYQFQSIGTGRQANAPRGLICGPGLPLYPHAYAAIEHQLGVRVVNQGTPEIVALAPDYRARVKRVRLSKTGATVEIEMPESSEGQVFGKVLPRERPRGAHALRSLFRKW